MKRRFAISLVLLLPFTAAASNLGDWLKTQLRQESADNALDPDTAAAGIRQALEQGTQRAVSSLGRVNGYFGNPRVKIPLPDSLIQVDKALRVLGQGKVADDFVLSMNRAAEAAAPQATAIFLQVIRNMSVKDAIGIVRGPDDAATSYFRAHSESALRDRFRPIIAAATDKVGVTRRYKQLLKQAGPVSSFLDTGKLDLDDYVTRKALDGLFLLVADEEKRIRQDPVARSTELLREVFGK